MHGSVGLWTFVQRNFVSPLAPLPHIKFFWSLWNFYQRLCSESLAHCCFRGDLGVGRIKTVGDTMMETIGWIGTVLVLFAYLKFNFKHWRSDSLSFQWLNLIGSVGLTINSFAKHVWPSVALNALWALIAVYSIHKPGPTSPPGHSP